MRRARWKALLSKSISACIAAMEIYNKPVMSHRDETFAMLAINAWELLLKARLLREAGNDLRAIQVLVPIVGKDGKPTKRMRADCNRAGNPKTITFGEALHRVANLKTLSLDPACAANLLSLIEIRNNAAHFIHLDAEMARRTHGVGCACLRNYAAAISEWFDQDLSEHRFMILPLSFEGKDGLKIPGRRSTQAANLLAYLDQASDAHPASDTSRYAASVRVETRIVGSRAKDAPAMRLTGGSGTPTVALTDEQIANQYPLDYAALQKRAKARMASLLFNKPFNNAVRTLKANQRYVFRRPLDPRNPKCKTVKEFYSEAAVDALLRMLATPAK